MKLDYFGLDRMGKKWNEREFNVSPSMTIPHFVSFILPTYNRLSFLISRIHNLLSSEYKNFEIIIIADGCTDGTNEYLSTLNEHKVKSIVCDTNSGNVTVPRNIGISFARGEWISHVDDDVIQFPDKITNLLSGSKTNNNLIVYGGRIETNWQTEEIINYSCVEDWRFGGVDTSQFIYKKEVYEKMPFVFSTHACDFCFFEMFKKEWGEEAGLVQRVDSAVCNYLWHDGNRTNKPDRKTKKVDLSNFARYCNVKNAGVLLTEH